MNYVTCDYPLPLPDEFDELVSPSDLSEIEFHTDLNQALSLDEVNSVFTYSIEADGQLYKKTTNMEYVEKEGVGVEIEEVDGGIEKSDYTGEIRFFHLFLEQEHDYFIEFSALFWKGDLKEMTLGKAKKEDNLGRKEIQETIHKAFHKSESNQKKWYAPFLGFYRKCVRFVFSVLRTIFMLFIKLFWTLERWIT